MSSDVDYINSSCHDAVIIVADDFNQLNTSLLENDDRLVHIVNGPTHCTHIIDKVLLVVLVFTGVLFTTVFLKTKHSTVLVTCDQPAPHMPHTRCRVQLYHHHHHHHQFIKNDMSDAHAYIIRTSQIKHTNRELY